MRIFTRLFNLAAVAVIISAGNQPAEARTTGFDLADYVHKTIKNKPESARERLADIERINALINKNTAPAVPLLGGAAVPAEDLKPSTTFGPANTFSDLDGPDGELWFYTMNLENEAIQHEYFTEYILKSYTVTIYDSKLNLVGTIHDNMEYADDEVRVAGCNLLPSATRYFFNDDDKCEIVIGLAVNTSVPGINRYRSLAYQIGGEKESDGTDKVIATIPELVCNVLDASTTDNPGNIYIYLPCPNIFRWIFQKTATYGNTNLIQKFTSRYMVRQITTASSMKYLPTTSATLIYPEIRRTLHSC